ncbi:CLUMA_CG014070, isoform A [Clunio marinus]|uniref:CLUMA_CG014070, isoform A n=1 Tax=Clunio marinus TaxID=568069 RepID=A0A1J1IKR4_9DIPT|nr:CLUMA_CG014070, isoform A [Clunio marinus]
MMNPLEINEYEQRELKNFVLLESSKDCPQPRTSKRFLQKSPTTNLRNSVSDKSTPRIRSASTGRDKRSEFQARYWAFLFGNLQRAIDEIYKTVEHYEHLASCQEAILVLENYIREFKALAGFFQMSWDYEKTPLPQRPHSLAWEVRKTSAMPRVRNKNIISPSMSGKSSPSSFSGTHSPCPTIEENKQVVKSTKVKSPENRIVKEASKPETVTSSENPAQAEKERKFEQLLRNSQPAENEQETLQKPKSLSMENLNKIESSSEHLQYFYQSLIEVANGSTQTEGIHDDDLTLLEYLNKYKETKKNDEIETEVKNASKESVKEKEGTSPEPTQCSTVTLTPTLSEVLIKPSATQNTQQSTTCQVSLPIRPPMRADYSLRNQTITSKSSKALPDTRKTTTVSTHRVNRQQTRMPSGTSTIPPSRPSTVLNRNRNSHQKCPQNTNFTMRSKTMIEIPKSQKEVAFRHSDLRKKRVPADDDTGSSSSTLKASTDKLSTKPNDLKKSDNKSGVQGSSDGWTTVKSKRRSSWSSQRFDQPSAFASLPTLALLNENGEESDKETSTTTLTVKGQVSSSGKSTKSQDNKTSTAKSQVEQQKKNSLNVKSGSKYLRSEKFAPMKKKTDVEEEKKVDMNVQTSTLLISRTIDNLYSELGGGNTSKFTTSNLSSCDEFDDDVESDDDHQKKLVEEQESLERQIRELENAEIEVDTETDETDCEAILCELEDNESSENNDLEGWKSQASFVDEEEISLEMRYAPMLAELTQLERAETLATLQELVARDPGRAQKLHQKLSSPSRRRSFHETLRKYQAKQTRAQEKRSELQHQKAQKIQHLIQRVEQVKAAKFQLTENRRLKIEEKLQRATENREMYLKNKIKKAHDEEEKLKEIAFIKNIEMQNKRLDLIESCKEQEGRLQDLEQERQKRQTEKLAKEQEVSRRRQEIEMERRKKLEKMDETRREREQRVGKIQEEKEKARQELAKEKQRDRDKRLQAIQQQQLQDTEELQRKIAQKQQEYQKRHEENIEHIRQRAFELAQQRNPDDVKSQNEDDEDSLEIAKRTRESIKMSKKKMRRIKEKSKVLSQEYLEKLPELSSNIRKQSTVPKLLNAIKKGNASSGVQMGAERPIGQIIRIIEKSNVVDFHALWLLDGLGTLANVIESGLQPNSDVTRVAVTKAVQLYRNACSSCKQIAQHSILGGSFIVLLDALLTTIENPASEVRNPSCPVETSTEIFLALTVVLSNLKPSENPAIGPRLPDVVSYLTSSGIIEQITRKCLMVREPIENQQSLLLPLLAMIGFLTKIIEISTRDNLMPIVKSTEIFGTITLLYKTMSLGETIPPRTVSLAGSTYNLIKAVALLDTNGFQEILNQERLTFKFLDVVTILLNYCGPKLAESDNIEMKAVIRDLIVIIGYFCANNRRNQNLLTSEQSYIILKSITKLPIDLAPFYYPTLLTIIWENPEAEAVLGKDFDIQMLKEYEGSALAKKNQLLNMLEI